MPRALHPDTKAALSSDTVEWAALVRFDFDSATLAFITLNKSVDVDGVTYVAAGDLGKVPPIAENTDTQPMTFEVTVAGIDLSVIALYLSEEYLMRPAYIGYAVIDENQDIIGEPIWIENLGVQRISVVDGRVPTITITCSSYLSDWTRVRAARYTDAEQQAYLRRLGLTGVVDKGFEFVPQLEERTIIWPSRQWFVDNG